MPHAAIVTVDIAAGQFDSAQKVLINEIVPRISKAPGFIKGYWTVRGDKTQGLSIIVFDSKQNAEAAAQTARNSPTPPGVKLNNVDIGEVVAEA